MKARPTFSKRNRERARQEKRKIKEEKAQQRKEESAARAEEMKGEDDPDIAGIVPGPQPLDPELFGVPGEDSGAPGSQS